MATVKTATLSKNFQGYKKDAQVLFVDNDLRFLIIKDTDDESFGWSVNTSKIPELENITTFENLSEDGFHLLFRLITKDLLKLPNLDIL